MAGELERINKQASDLVRGARVNMPDRWGLSSEEKFIYKQGRERAATVDAAQRLASLASRLDVDLAMEMHEGVMNATASMDDEVQLQRNAKARQVGDRLTELFSEQTFAHNAAYYHAFAEQAMREATAELPAPPKRTKWFGR